MTIMIAILAVQAENGSGMYPGFGEREENIEGIFVIVTSHLEGGLCLINCAC